MWDNYEAAPPKEQHVFRIIEVKGFFYVQEAGRYDGKFYGCEACAGNWKWNSYEEALVALGKHISRWKLARPSIEPPFPN